ncbi:MAG: 1-(5-phosphoribosyl)-5-[(5-phosphoribosylamino)methylideneamino] imidazole-4-carboxamide isomerase [Deltaproteobacteria bacterium]|nr:1-(5-phosphoribosyl)-5-[(5-phosphoribosylamino)methylideneamino] imidazole-4-carboxamide isomerase [Deltaproteobacteria bacterium]
MLLIPAIDLKDGQCVRLMQGDFSRPTVYGSDPSLMAERWARAGAELIHLVDLDGSLGKSEPNREALKAIRKKVGVELQLGGGLRSLESMRAWIEIGVDKIVLGTAVCLDRPLVEEACRLWPGRVLAALDAIGRSLKIRGWREDGRADLFEAAAKLKKMGVSQIIYTDIDRDGMREGPNLPVAAEVARMARLPLIISGGVSNLADLAAAYLYSDRDLFYGVISGKALYEGSLSFEEGRALLSGEICPLAPFF